MMEAAPHIPVMLPEVLAALSPKDGEIYVDGTFGAGGYSRAILDRADCRVIAIDRDRSALDRAAGWKEKYRDRLILVHGNFGDVEIHLKKLGFAKIDGFILDIGVSSMQIDEADRGFSFRFDGPLDMRMDRDYGENAADLVNGLKEEALADLIYKYGEERLSRRIAKAIVAARAEEPIESTLRLAEIVRASTPRPKNQKIDPATRTFQALRIAVNDELGELERALEASCDILSDGGRLVVVTFHSLEDRIVKNFLKENSGRREHVSRYAPETSSQQNAPFRLINRKAVEASQEESLKNSRARSAKMRYAIKTHRIENNKPGALIS